MSRRMLAKRKKKNNIESPIYLVDGNTFNSKINELIKRATTTITSIVFTKEPIPTEKIIEGIDVSESASEYKAYGYIDGNTIYISPEIKGGVLYANENCSRMFILLNKINYIYFYNINTFNTINMDNIFSSCTQLIETDISCFDMSNVKNTYCMYYYCSNLKNIKGIEKIEDVIDADMRAIFNNCKALSGSITIRHSKIKSYNWFFAGTSTSPNSKFIVKYIDEETKAMAEKLVATKETVENVFLWEGEDN